MINIRWAGAFVCGMVLAGCATKSLPAFTASQSQLALNPYDSPGNRPDILLTGRTNGRLASDGRCITLATRNGAVTPLWPGGTRIESRGRKTVVILPDGRGTAVVGGEVRLGGGALPASQREGLSDFVRRSCPGVYFVVSNVA
jgi:hypothetical protein